MRTPTITRKRLARGLHDLAKYQNKSPKTRTAKVSEYESPEKAFEALADAIIEFIRRRHTCGG